jgi:hypothetical protein
MSKRHLDDHGAHWHPDQIHTEMDTAMNRHRRFEAVPAAAAVLKRHTSFETRRFPATSLARVDTLARYLDTAESDPDG